MKSRSPLALIFTYPLLHRSDLRLRNYLNEHVRDRSRRVVDPTNGKKETIRSQAVVHHHHQTYSFADNQNTIEQKQNHAFLLPIGSMQISIRTGQALRARVNEIIALKRERNISILSLSPSSDIVPASRRPYTAICTEGRHGRCDASVR